MAEIYRKHADRYHKLVVAEDRDGNLASTLTTLCAWRGVSVLEAGTGTGRVTACYIDQVSSAICCDRSEHMLSHARDVLAAHRGKITFLVADNLDLPLLAAPVDVFIEGWSFGHAIIDAPTNDEIRARTALLVHNATKNLVAGGTAVIIETMGTNTEHPTPMRRELEIFYGLLEAEHGFSARVIRTDYAFASNREAARALGFFFGKTMAAGVRRRGTAVIPEHTGIWSRRA